jgi:hypothetical protein
MVHDALDLPKGGLLRTTARQAGRPYAWAGAPEYHTVDGCEILHQLIGGLSCTSW